MAVSYFVRYRAPVAVGFVDYYRDRHAPILAQFPGLTGLVLHTPAPWRDPFPVHADPTGFLAEMRFASLDDLAAALASPERARARDDFARLPGPFGEVTHQAMTSLVVK
jgi:uncharacterized protein (TIGR02118 family)